MKTTHRYGVVFFFLIFGLISVGAYWYFSRDVSIIQTQTKAEDKIATKEYLDVSLYETKIKNATIVVPDTKTQISLVDGRASYGTNLDGGDVSFVKLLGGFQVSGVGHVFGDLVVQSGGTGSFHYLVLFDIVKEKVVYRSSYFVGDRVVLVSATTSPVTSSSYNVTLEYLDRKEGDAMVDDPSVQTFISIPVKNGVFVQSEL